MMERGESVLLKVLRDGKIIVFQAQL